MSTSSTETIGARLLQEQIEAVRRENLALRAACRINIKARDLLKESLSHHDQELFQERLNDLLNAERAQYSLYLQDVLNLATGGK